MQNYRRRKKAHNLVVTDIEIKLLNQISLSKQEKANKK